MTAGSLREQAAGLSAAQLDALARWVSGADMASAASNARCPPAATTADTALTSLLADPQWNGWGAGPAQRRYQPAAMAGLEAADVSKLELKWAFGFADSTRAFAQPTVVGGRVYVGSASEIGRAHV